jgi:hypothetical protein
MKRKQPDNISFVIGWLCGAVFVAFPVVAIVYLFLRRTRPAVQAAMIGVIAFPCIIGVRAAMLAAGVQHKPLPWMGLNGLVFLVVPSFATAIAAAIPWPGIAGGHRSGEREP